MCMCRNDLDCHRPLLREESSDVAVEDLDLLFAAVNARLRLLADPQPGPESADASDMRAGVAECAQAQEQLAATALHELGRHH